MAQWLRLCNSTAEGMGSIPGQGTEIRHATGCSQKGKEIQIEMAQPHLSSLHPSPAPGYCWFVPTLGSVTCLGATLQYGSSDWEMPRLRSQVIPIRVPGT